MNEKLKMNYISLLLSIFLTFFMGFMYFLLGKSMSFPLKVGYAVVTFSLIVLIGFNIIAIIKKSNDKAAKQ